MAKKPTYEELEQRVHELDEEAVKRKQAEEALRESEERFRLLYERAPLGYQSLDEHGHLLEVNQAWLDTLGYTREEVIGKSFGDFLHPDWVDHFKQNFSRFKADGESRGVEFKMMKKDGSLIMVAFNGKIGRDEKGDFKQTHCILHDITSQKKSEEALQESEDKFRSFAEQSLVGIYLISNDVFKYVNPKFAEIFGYSVDECLNNMHFPQLVHPEDLATVEKQVGRRLSGETKAVRYSFRGIKKSGETIHVEIFGSSMLLKGKSVATGTMLDITEAKRAQEALLNQTYFLQKAQEIGQIGTWELDIKKNELLWTDENYKIFGLPIGTKLTYKTFLNCVHPDDREYVDKEWKAAFDKKPYDIEHRLLVDGKVKWVREKAELHFNEKDECIRGTGFTQDITVRKQAEEALQESEEKYRSMMESMKDPIYICSQDYRVEYMNPSMIQRTGRDATGENCFKALHDLDEKCPWCLHYKTQQGEYYESEIVSPKDNRSYHVSSSPIVHGDGSISKMTVFRDTTDLKKLETQLQQASKMEAMGTLAGGIAHDFNNLLMAIQGRASIMLMNKDSSHPDIKHLKGIEDNIESAADLTNQLLGFARGGKYEVRPTDINELIKKQNRMFGRTKKEITIRGKYEKDLWSVEVDRGQIEQALLNLYVNAWQAMPGGGDLHLETENVTLDENYVKPFSIEPGRYVKISVTDTGVGMDKATQERIFDPFFTTKEMDRGTGLGLASVYGIIKNHGGFINVYSEKGHGTTFNIYLPASEKEVIEEKKSAGDTLRGTETVLFIDDEDMIIEIAEELFEQLGYKVLTARSGKEAIEIYEENKERIDIVILDMIMPDVSGGDTYDRMKEINPKVKVLLSSGYSINGQATEILDRGCNGFIQKPFKMKELSQKLREILDK